MLYRELGKTGKKVSILGLGCMRLPTIDGAVDQINEPLATDMIHYAIDHSVNYIDTAYPYHASSPTEGGRSEILVGNALKEGYRDQVYLATKLPIWLIQNSEDMNRYLNEQLQRLQTDKIDFYLLHGLHKRFWENLIDFNVFEFLDSAIEDGRIGYAGFSFHDELEFFKEVIKSYNWSFTQIQYNYMDQNFQAGRAGLEYAANKGLGTIIMEPLRGGCLTKNIPDDIQNLWDESKVKRSLAEWGLRFLWDQSNINMVLSGMSTMEQVIENIKIAEEGYPQSLMKAEKDLIKNVRKAYSERIHVDCTTCNYCMPCPAGVNIPLNLSLLNDVYIYKNLDKPAGNYFHLSARKMSAAYCIDCGECEEKCTQNIPIKKYLEETAIIFEKK